VEASRLDYDTLVDFLGRLAGKHVMVAFTWKTGVSGRAFLGSMRGPISPAGEPPIASLERGIAHASQHDRITRFQIGAPDQPAERGWFEIDDRYFEDAVVWEPESGQLSVRFDIDLADGKMITVGVMSDRYLTDLQEGSAM
jgi:hypothetical protein